MPEHPKQNIHKRTTFTLTLQIISEIQVILGGVLTKLHISFSVKNLVKPLWLTIIFDILAVLCIRLKLYGASEALNFDRNILGKLIRKHSTEKILRQSISCVSNYLHIHLWHFKTVDFLLLFFFIFTHTALKCRWLEDLAVSMKLYPGSERTNNIQ